MRMVKPAVTPFSGAVADGAGFSELNQMTADVSAWHYWLCDAIVAKDVVKARAICDEVMAERGFEQDHPVHQALRLLVASHVGHQGWLEEAEASLARNVEQPAISAPLQTDAKASAHFIAGLMRIA